MIVRMKDSEAVVHVSDETARVLIESKRAEAVAQRIVEHAVAPAREVRG